MTTLKASKMGLRHLPYDMTPLQQHSGITITALLNPESSSGDVSPLSYASGSPQSTMMDLSSILNPVPDGKRFADSALNIVIQTIETCSIENGFHGNNTKALKSPNIQHTRSGDLQFDRREARRARHRRRSVLSTSPSSPRGGPPPSARAPGSNHPYEDEQLHAIQYLKEDHSEWKWDQRLKQFLEWFPEGEWVRRGSPACLTSRYYREQFWPDLDHNDKLILGVNGRPRMIHIKVQERDRHPKGAQLRRLGYFSFVQSHPSLALKYNWVSAEHKELARNLLRMRNGQSALPGVFEPKAVNE